MNYKNHITHWRGKALKDLTRDEALEGMQELNRLYQGALDNIQGTLVKTGRADIFNN